MIGICRRLRVWKYSGASPAAAAIVSSTNTAEYPIGSRTSDQEIASSQIAPSEHVHRRDLPPRRSALRAKAQAASTPDRNSSIAAPHSAVSGSATKRHGCGNQHASTAPKTNGSVGPKPNTTSRAGIWPISGTVTRRSSGSVRVRPRLLRVPSSRSRASPSP